MEDMVVTRYWMAGVVGLMAIYGVIAVVGYIKSRSRNNEESVSS